MGSVMGCMRSGWKTGMALEPVSIGMKMARLGDEALPVLVADC